MNEQLLVNSIQTPDGTLLVSYTVHDYKTHEDKNGETYMVDGGRSYLRRNLNKEPAKELSVFVDSKHYYKRLRFEWGTYGKEGKGPFRRVKLMDMTDNHIEAILTTQDHIPDHIRDMFQDELSWRAGDDGLDKTM